MALVTDDLRALGGLLFMFDGIPGPRDALHGAADEIDKLRAERDELARAVAKHVRWHHMVDAPYKDGTHRCMGCWAPAWQDETDEDSNNWTMRCEHLPGCPVVLAGQVLREEAEDEADRD